MNPVKDSVWKSIKEEPSVFPMVFRTREGKAFQLFYFLFNLLLVVSFLRGTFIPDKALEQIRFRALENDNFHFQLLGLLNNRSFTSDHVEAVSGLAK